MIKQESHDSPGEGESPHAGPADGRVVRVPAGIQGSIPHLPRPTKGSPLTAALTGSTGSYRSYSAQDGSHTPYSLPNLPSRMTSNQYGWRQRKELNECSLLSIRPFTRKLKLLGQGLTDNLSTGRTGLNPTQPTGLPVTVIVDALNPTLATPDQQPTHPLQHALWRQAVGNHRGEMSQAVDQVEVGRMVDAVVSTRAPGMMRCKCRKHECRVTLR
jgi:hypothetical protein